MIPLQARAAWAGLSLTVKAVIWAILIALVLFAGWKGYRAIYDAGVADERAVWVAAQEEAGRQQRAHEAAQEAAALALGDASRATGEQERAEIQADTTETNEAIENEYRKDPASAVSCTPDNRPAPIPKRVLEELRQARRSAETAAR